jgi:hypothetical protein
MEESIYKTPKAELELNNSDSEDCLFFPTSGKKLLVLFFSTLGMYSIYWFYKQWSYQRKYMEGKINPALRSIFYIFFTHSLFGRIKDASEKKGVSTNINFSALATIYVIAEIVSNGLDRAANKMEYVGFLDYASIATLVILAYPLYAVQKVANKVNGDPEGDLNSIFSVYNYVFIGLGGILWLFIIAMFLQIDLGQIAAQIS